MNLESVYLRPDVAVEPLLNRWVVDVNLVPPVQSALTWVHSQLKILKSFISMPKAHRDASRNPALLGGPFMDAGLEQLEQVQELLRTTEAAHSDWLELAEAVRALEALVLSDTTGMGLEPLYPKVPDLLRGYVELSYDLSHRASARFIEPLLYRSRFYKRGAQSLGLSVEQSDIRSFAYSTPRLDAPGRVFLPLAFDDARVDLLHRSRFEPARLSSLAEALEVPGEQQEAFASLFTDSPLRPFTPFTGPGVRVRYFGHATVLIESAEGTVLADPTIPLTLANGTERFSFAELPPRIDAVVLTHAHADHLNLETLLALRHRVDRVIVPRSSGGALADPSLELLLRHTGFKNVCAAEDLESFELPGGRLTAIPFLGEHGDLSVRAKAGYLVELGGKRLFVAGDAAVLEHRLYALMEDLLGGVDGLFIAMESHGAPLSWGYGPLFSKPPSRQMDLARRQTSATFPQLQQLLQRVKPKAFFNYALGLEPWLRHMVAVSEKDVPVRLEESKKVVAWCTGQGFKASTLYARSEFFFSE